MSNQVRRLDLTPKWRVGNSWRVEYQRSVPSKVKGPVTEHPPPQKSIWRYEVLEADPDKQFVVQLAEEDGDDRRFELIFDGGSLCLVAIVAVQGTERERVDETVAGEPYFGWSQAQPVLFDWPRFADSLRGFEHEFETADEKKVRQSATALEAAAFRVVFVAEDEDEPETMRSEQVWKPGEPWWETAVVETAYGTNEQPEVVVFLRGKRIH